MTHPYLAEPYNPGTATKTANYTLTVADKVIYCNGTFNVTLETAVGCAGRPHTVKNIGTGVITMLTTSSQTIDDDESGFITLEQFDSLTVVSDGANWGIV